MKNSALLPAFAAILCCSCTSVTVDPRSRAYAYPSGYQVQPASQGTSSSAGRIQISVPQPTPIRTKPGTSSTPYDTPSNTGPSPYDSSSGGSSPLRHETQDKPLYTR